MRQECGINKHIHFKQTQKHDAVFIENCDKVFLTEFIRSVLQAKASLSLDLCGTVFGTTA